MGRHRYYDSTAATPEPVLEPIIRLWILRILLPLSGHRRFLHESGFSDDALARQFGLSAGVTWAMRLGLSEDDAKDFQQQTCADLQRLYSEAEKTAKTCAISDTLRKNVARLAALVGLSDTDCRILEFIVLMQISGALQTATEYLDQVSSLQTFHALSVILALPEADVRAAFGRQGKLTQSALVTLDRRGRNDLNGKLSLLNGDFAERIFETDADPIHLLKGCVTLADPGQLTLDDYPHLQHGLSIMLPYLRHVLDTGRKGVNICLYGRAGTGKTQLARALAAQLNCELFEVDCENADGNPIHGDGRLRAFKSAQSFFAHRRVCVAFDEMEDVFGNGNGNNFLGIFLGSRDNASENKGWINRHLEENPAPTFWISNSIRGVDPAAMRRFDMVLEVPVPPRSQRQRIAREACGDLVGADCIDRLSESEHLAPAVITRAARVVRAANAADGQLETAAARGKALETLIDNTLEAQRHPGLKRGDAARLPETYDPGFLHADADLAAIASGLDARRRGRLCLYGPPGTGKTAYGHWLAQRLDMPLVSKRASDLLSCWVGMSEQNIAAAFREAEKSESILMIDEVDSFLQDRRAAARSWEVTQTNEMLTQMEAFPGIFIASTNLMDGLDPATLRRFDLKVKFDFLTSAQSRALLCRHCEHLALPPPDEHDMSRLGRLDKLTPGDFAAIARQHGFHPLCTATQWVDRLTQECALKGGTKKPIGF